MKGYTEEKIIKQMQEHYEKYGKITIKSFDKDKSTCSFETVQKYLGSWSTAKIRAEINDYIEYEEEKLKKLIRGKIISGELKHMSAIERLKGFPSYKYLKTLWSKEEMEEIFGIKIKKFAYSAEEVISIYNEMKEKYGIVTLLLLREEAGMTPGVIRRHFGTWNKFLDFMGEKPRRVLANVTHTNEELIELYKKLSFKIGKEQYGATLRDLKQYNFPYSKSVISSRFTSINNLGRIAGFDIKRDIISKYSKQSLKLQLYKSYKKYGRRLSQAEIEKDELLPNPSSIFYHFQTTKITEVWDEVLNKK